VLNREPHTEGHIVSTGPYDDPTHALEFALAAQNDPPREFGSMDFENVELVESAKRPAPSFDQVRRSLRAKTIPSRNPGRKR
jgi:hypothetical protein